MVRLRREVQSGDGRGSSGEDSLLWSLSQRYGKRNTRESSERIPLEGRAVLSPEFLLFLYC